ncbi:MAG: phosphate ABC transporter substrate-binding protein PstS family protein [Clostridia bacterium]|nr:phosphate ABC transporter substrate-binding protein PstS family protein [Clostridia bacterium]
MSKLLKSKIVVLGLVAVLSLGVLAGCSSPAAEEKETSTETAPAVEVVEEGQATTLEGHVNVVGSTSVTPVAQEIAEAFMAKEPGVKVDVQGVGSSAGVKAASDGSADIGMASRNLKEGEKEWGLTEHVLAFDGIAVVVNPANGVGELTADQATAIFKGEITNWKDVGGADQEILVISREAGSGTRGAFEELLDLEAENAEGKTISAVKKDALVAEGNGAVKANVAKKEYAIGYLSLSYVDETVKGVSIDGVAPSVDAIVAGEYNVSRPFLLLTKGELSPAAQAYMDFAFSEEGQAIVAEKLIPVQ